MSFGSLKFFCQPRTQAGIVSSGDEDVGSVLRKLPRVAKMRSGQLVCSGHADPALCTSAATGIS